MFLVGHLNKTEKAGAVIETRYTKLETRYTKLYHNLLC